MESDPRLILWVDDFGDASDWSGQKNTTELLPCPVVTSVGKYARSLLEPA